MALRLHLALYPGRHFIWARDISRLCSGIGLNATPDGDRFTVWLGRRQGTHPELCDFEAQTTSVLTPRWMISAAMKRQKDLRRLFRNQKENRRPGEGAGGSESTCERSQGDRDCVLSETVACLGYVCCAAAVTSQFRVPGFLCHFVTREWCGPPCRKHSPGL